jgi:hypothetical protein
MLTTETLAKTIKLFQKSRIHSRIMDKAGISGEEAKAVRAAYDAGKTEQLFREIQLAGVLELAAAKLRLGEGWNEVTIGDVLREISHVYPKFTKTVFELAFPPE